MKASLRLYTLAILIQKKILLFTWCASFVVHLGWAIALVTLVKVGSFSEHRAQLVVLSDKVKAVRTIAACWNFGFKGIYMTVWLSIQFKGRMEILPLSSVLGFHDRQCFSRNHRGLEEISRMLPLNTSEPFWPSPTARSIFNNIQQGPLGWVDFFARAVITLSIPDLINFFLFGTYSSHSRGCSC